MTDMGQFTRPLCHVPHQLVNAKQMSETFYDERLNMKVDMFQVHWHNPVPQLNHVWESVTDLLCTLTVHDSAVTDSRCTTWKPNQKGTQGWWLGRAGRVEGEPPWSSESKTIHLYLSTPSSLALWTFGSTAKLFDSLAPFTPLWSFILPTSLWCLVLLVSSWFVDLWLHRGLLDLHLGLYPLHPSSLWLHHAFPLSLTPL